MNKKEFSEHAYIGFGATLGTFIVLLATCFACWIIGAGLSAIAEGPETMLSTMINKTHALGDYRLVVSIIVIGIGIVLYFFFHWLREERQNR